MPQHTDFRLLEHVGKRAFIDDEIVGGDDEEDRTSMQRFSQRFHDAHVDIALA